jgi:hypothetical protein
LRQSNEAVLLNLTSKRIGSGAGLGSDGLGREVRRAGEEPQSLDRRDKVPHRGGAQV